MFNMQRLNFPIRAKKSAIGGVNYSNLLTLSIIRRILHVLSAKGALFMAAAQNLGSIWISWHEKTEMLPRIWNKNLLECLQFHKRCHSVLHYKFCTREQSAKDDGRAVCQLGSIAKSWSHLDCLKNVFAPLYPCSPAVIHCSNFIFFHTMALRVKSGVGVLPAYTADLHPSVAAGQLFHSVPGVSPEQRGQHIFLQGLRRWKDGLPPC